MATFFEIGLEMQLGKDNQLMKIHRLIKWERLRGYLKKVRKTDPVTGGREGYDEFTIFSPYKHISKAIISNRPYKTNNSIVCGMIH